MRTLVSLQIAICGLLIVTHPHLAAAAPPAAATPAAAAARTLTPAQPPQTDERIRVQLDAQQQTTLSAEISAKLLTLPVKEGQRFQTGQVLAGFDCAINHAQLKKAEATADAARQTVKVNKRLQELDSISTLEMDLAEAKLREAEAEASMMRVMQGKCGVIAPFTGRIAKIYVEPHQFVAQGKPLLDIVDTRRLELKLLVPSRWLSWLKQGSKFKVHIDELNADTDARVTRLGARIDPVNQMIVIYGEVANSSDKLLPGMSGWAIFNQPGTK